MIPADGLQEAQKWSVGLYDIRIKRYYLSIAYKVQNIQTRCKFRVLFIFTFWISFIVLNGQKPIFIDLLLLMVLKTVAVVTILDLRVSELK